MQFYEDIAVGQKSAFGQYEVTREEVIDFARKYDPQPFHLDDDAAAKTHFGRISDFGPHFGPHFGFSAYTENTFPRCVHFTPTSRHPWWVLLT